MTDLISLLPENDTGQFLTGVLISTGMVTPDAFLWLLGSVPALVALGLRLKHLLAISLMIALAHQVYGVLGLGIRTLFGPLEFIIFPVILVAVTYMVYGFVIYGSADPEEEEEEEISARKLMQYGIFSLAAFFGIYTGVSIDELFAVLGRVEWMASQGWSYWMMLANITVAMALLGLILAVEVLVLYFIIKVSKNTAPMKWILKHEKWIMFMVFSFLVYFVNRGWWQNLLGNQPVELHLKSFNTGFAYWVYLTAGLLPMILLRIAMLSKSIKILLLKAFEPQKRFLDWIEEASKKRAERRLSAT